MAKNSKGLLLTAAGALLLLTGAPVRAAEPTTEVAKIEQAAAQAKSPAQHAAVAKQYRLRAEALEGMAKDHAEKAAKAGPAQTPGMAHKWPAMVSNSRERQNQQAMQYRRAAEEARTLAAKHTQLAVEAQLVGE